MLVHEHAGSDRVQTEGDTVTSEQIEQAKERGLRSLPEYVPGSPDGLAMVEEMLRERGFDEAAARSSLDRDLDAIWGTT